MNSLIKRAAVLFLPVVALTAMACGGNEPATATPPPGGPELALIAVGRDLGLGINRVPLALMHNDQTPISDRVEDLSFSIEHVETRETQQVTEVTWREWPIRGGVYVLEPEFDIVGPWQVKVTLNEDGRTLSGEAAVIVNEKTATPAVGDPAPDAVTKTGDTPEELRQLTSAIEPDPDLYQVSLGDAVKSGAPVVALFSTPAFCQTQTCGPQVEVVQELKEQFNGQAHFVHVEIWDNPREMLDTGDTSVGVISPAVEAWGLPTEPWTFLVDEDGRIFAKFEAFTTKAELTEAMEAMLGA
ncbi:MAG: hypothetical protein WD208_11180 [Dehalococcoidia bacterium]